MPGGRVGMPGGGGGRKDILVVQDENDGQTVNAKTRRDPLRRLPLQLRRRLKRGGWRVDNWLTQLMHVHDTSTGLAVFAIEILVQSTQK